jgi:hypothetical protein
MSTAPVGRLKNVRSCYVFIKSMYILLLPLIQCQKFCFKVIGTDFASILMKRFAMLEDFRTFRMFK